LKQAATRRRASMVERAVKASKKWSLIRQELEDLSNQEVKKLPQKRRLCKNALDSPAKKKKQNLERKLDRKLVGKNKLKTSEFEMTNEDLEQISQMMEEFKFEKYRQKEINHNCLALIEAPEPPSPNSHSKLGISHNLTQDMEEFDGSAIDTPWTRSVRAAPIRRYYDNIERLISDPILAAVWETYYGANYLGYLELEGVFDCTNEAQPNSLGSTAHSSGVKSLDNIKSGICSGSPLGIILEKSGQGENPVQNPTEMMSRINTHVHQALESGLLKSCFCERSRGANSEIIYCCEETGSSGIGPSMNGWLKQHPQLNYQMRRKLLDWMREYSAAAKLKRKTYHLGVEIVDRYLACTQNLDVREYQLLGAVSMLLASKHEDCLLNFWNLKYLMPSPQLEAKARALEYDICIVRLI
jgi:Cyclin, N-terminal domain